MYFRKLKGRSKKQDTKDGASTAPTDNSDTNTKKRTVTIGRWNRLYYGFQGFDPTESPKKETRKKAIVVTPQDMDIIDYCYHKVIASKEHEISALKKTNKALMRDHQYKDGELEMMKQKFRELKEVALKQRARLLAEAEYREREWAIEKKQLLQEIDWALRGIAPQEHYDDYDDDDLDTVTDDNCGFRSELLNHSPTSVRDLIYEKEAWDRKEEWIAIRLEQVNRTQ